MSRSSEALSSGRSDDLQIWNIGFHLIFTLCLIWVFFVFCLCVTGANGAEEGGGAELTSVVIPGDDQWPFDRMDGRDLATWRNLSKPRESARVWHTGERERRAWKRCDRRDGCVWRVRQSEGHLGTNLDRWIAVRSNGGGLAAHKIILGLGFCNTWAKTGQM
ncbi:hypothetical protein V6N13_058932 [Hibiscus sabdariffa]